VTETAIEAAAVPGEAADLLTSMDVIRYARISFRQLDFWHRAGLLEAEHQWNGSGSLRLWSRAEAAVIRDMGRLVAAGLPLRDAARIARSGQPRTEIAPNVWLELGPALSEHCGGEAARDA
jgi:DNA-binding transcriptional MerR regulator